jgi:hypothetical protein
MKLYRTIDGEDARAVIENETLAPIVERRELEGGRHAEVCILRDVPPVGFASAGPAADDVDPRAPAAPRETSDFVLSVDVPEDEALPYEVRFEPPSPAFREVWLPLPVVDRHATSVVIHEWDGSHVWPGGEAFGP